MEIVTFHTVSHQEKIKTKELNLQLSNSALHENTSNLYTTGDIHYGGVKIPIPLSII